MQMGGEYRLTHAWHSWRVDGLRVIYTINVDGQKPMQLQVLRGSLVRKCELQLSNKNSLFAVSFCSCDADLLTGPIACTIRNIHHECPSPWPLQLQLLRGRWDKGLKLGRKTINHVGLLIRTCNSLPLNKTRLHYLRSYCPRDRTCRNSNRVPVL